MADLKRLLEKIQSADEATKRKVLIAGSAVAMVLVIFIWLSYFNSLLQPIQAPAETAGAAGPSFLSVMKTGLAVVYGFLTDRISFLINFIKQPRGYIIKP